MIAAAPPVAAAPDGITQVARGGRMGWQRATGYGRRNQADTAIFRYKHLIGPKLHAPGGHVLSIASLLLGALCLVVILADVVRHPQHMGIMSVVWPVTARFGTIWVAGQYVR